MSSVNQFKNILGLFPRGWRVPLVYRHESENAEGGKRSIEKKEILVRLMGIQRQELPDRSQPAPPDKPAPS